MLALRHAQILNGGVLLTPGSSKHICDRVARGRNFPGRPPNRQGSHAMRIGRSQRKAITPFGRQCRPNGKEGLVVRVSGIGLGRQSNFFPWARVLR